MDTNLTIDIEGNEVFLRDDVANRQVGTTFVLDKQIEEMTPDGRIVQVGLVAHSANVRPRYNINVRQQASYFWLRSCFILFIRRNIKPYSSF